MIYSREQLYELKSKIDYFEFYQKFLPDLTQRGSNRAFACCCFHSETRPSLCVDLECGIWRCFGACNMGGDCFKFYQKYYNVDFKEAVQKIAEMYNYELIVSEEELKEREYKKSLYNVNEIMCKKYQQSLKANNSAYNYLTELRGFSPKIIQDFRLGCGINKLPDKESLKILGLLVPSDNGGYYSKFRNDRVVIPRFDEYGNILSFTGRLHEDKEGAKYLHTTDTEIYKKSELVFGLYQAKRYIKEFKSAIVVEGECFKPEAEVLTPNGWLRFDEYNGEKVMQVKDDLTGEFVQPLARIIKDYDGEMLKCNTKSCKIEATPNHNIVFIDKNNNLNKKMFKEINTNQVKIPTSIKFYGEGLNISDDMIKLLIAIQADGTIDYRKNGDKYIRISFKKIRKVERFEDLLIKNKISYTKTLSKNNYTYFGFRCNEAFKEYPISWLNMSQEQLQLVISELVHWDGNKVPNRSQIEYSSSNYKNAEFIQTIAHLCGYSSTIMKRKNKFGEWYKVSILFQKKHVTMNSYKIKKIPYKGKVYCVEVPSGKILVRINGKISIVGNCDVIKCHQKGICNTVCLSGLNISDSQVNLLKRYTNTFYVCVEDGAILKPNDEGKTSLDKFYEKIKQHIKYAKVYVIDLRNKDGSKCDPDMYLNEHTRQEFNKLVKYAKIYNEFIINEKLKYVNPKNIEEKTACINSLIPSLAQISNFLDRKQYIELVSNKLLIPENDIYRKCKIHNENKVKYNKCKIEYDERPIYAQKILLSICFCKNFDISRVVTLIILNVLDKMEAKYANIFKSYIQPYILEHWDKENNTIDFSTFFNNLEFDDTMTEDIRNIILDCYMKREQLEDLDQEDLDELVNEQIESINDFILPSNDRTIDSI